MGSRGREWAKQNPTLMCIVERGELNVHAKKYIEAIQPNHGIINHCTSYLISKQDHKIF